VTIPARVINDRLCDCQSCPSEVVGVKRVPVEDVKGEVSVANNCVIGMNI